MSDHQIVSSGLPAPTHLRVGTNPDAVAYDKYAEIVKDIYPKGAEVFVKGIYRDQYLGSVTKAKQRIGYAWLGHFVEHDEQAHLRNAERHIEAGYTVPEPYSDINKSDESLSPLSGPHLNIISETDRTIERWAIRVSYNREDFATYFYDYSTFKEFMDMLKGNLMNGLQSSLAIITKAVLTSDPSRVNIDDKDIARIFGATWDRRALEGNKGRLNLLLPDQKVAKRYIDMMEGLINKYSSKAINLWKNITWYNPYNLVVDVAHSEGLRRGFIYGATDDSGTQITSDKDFVKVQIQQTYTDAHKDSTREDSNNGKTKRITDLHRNDCLFALFYAIKNAANVLVNERSTEFWLGNDTSLLISQSPESWGEWQKKMMEAASHGLVGHPVIPGVETQNLANNYNEETTRSKCYGFEVTTNRDDLILLLNPEDYDDLDTGVARRGPIDVRAVNLDMLRKYCPNIYPLRGMKPGFARLIDKRAFKIRSYYQATHVQEPAELIHWRYKFFYFYSVTMFSLFGGTLIVPTPHFVASPRFYDKYGLIGQKIEVQQEK